MTLLSFEPLSRVVPLSPDAAELTRRAAAFLCGVGLPSMKPRAIAAGYTGRDHRRGLELHRWASGELTYRAWLDREVRDPRREPDDPELLGRLEAVIEELSVAATAAIGSFVTGEDRDRLVQALFEEGSPPPRTRFGRAARLLHSMDYLADFRMPGSEAAGAAIQMGQNAGTFRQATALVQELQRTIREAPVDEERVRDIAGSMADAQGELARWLDQQSARVGALDGGVASRPDAEALEAFLRID